MKSIIGLVLFFASSSCFSNIFKPIVDIRIFDEVFINLQKNYNFIYLNEGFQYKQAYFYDKEYVDELSFHRAYSISTILVDNNKYYEYSEHYYNCDSKEKIIFTQKFNEIGKFINSSFSKYNIGEFYLKLDEIICK